MTPPQDSVSDVERLQQQLRLAAGRLHWAATVAAKNHGAAALLAKWSEEADAALAVPINKIGEDARTYADVVEDAAKLCDAYVDVNFEQSGDSVLLDPCLRGKGFTPENIAASERLQIDGLVHSSQAHAGQHLATAIRRLSTSTDKGVS